VSGKLCVESDREERMILSRQYLLFASFIAFFRVGIYIFRWKAVTQVKIDPKAWEDPKIQEVAYAFTYMIRTMMLLKGIVFSYSSFLKNSEERDVLALISFGFDLYMLLNMIRKYQISKSKDKGGESSKSQVVLPAATPGMIIQSILTLSYLLCFGLEYFGFVR
jgi:hypothetical protein